MTESLLFQLSKAEHAPYFALLQLFAYGTYQDYQREPKSADFSYKFYDLSLERKGTLPSLNASNNKIEIVVSRFALNDSTRK